jgi:hypothetical protein
VVEKPFNLDATKRGLLERALKLLGKEQLARRLNIPTALFDDWVRGDATMPDGKLMELARTMDKLSREPKWLSEKDDGDA